LEMMRTLFGLSILALFCVSIAHAGDWNSNEISYWYGDNFREPGVAKFGKPADVPKDIVSIAHADGIGSMENFIDIDVLRSIGADPSGTSNTGATEIYVVDRHDIFLNRVLDVSMPHFIRDAGLEFGGDLNTKNTAFDPNKRMPVAGLATFLDVPGFCRIALLWDKEWNNNGITHTRVAFNSTARLETAWGIPFSIAKANFTFEGYGDYNGPKGTDGFGAKMQNEILIHSQIMLDVGSWLDRPRLLKVGGGYEYWFNKFGNDHGLVQGSLASTPFVRISSAFSF